MPNLYDLMTPQDRETMKRWADERRNPKHPQEIPTPLYICAQLGYYYGWEAVVDYRRGYHIGVDKDGKLKRYSFQLEEAIGLIKAAEKVHYRLSLDNGRIVAANQVSSRDTGFAKRNAAYVSQIEERANTEILA